MTRPRATLAILVPALNEEIALAATLRSLAAQSAPADRVLVIDGGSRDATAEVGRAHGAEVLTASGGGRGGQIATGLAALGGATEGVLVAHADMLFPTVALEAVRSRLESDPACPGGCLGHRFDSPKRIYRLIEWQDRRRARGGMSYGDQAQFFRPRALAEVGGYPNQPIMEDLELSLRLCRAGRPAYLDLPVTVSPRRFERLGWPRVLWTNWRFRRIYRRHGAAACREIFERYYPRPVKAEATRPS